MNKTQERCFNSKYHTLINSLTTHSYKPIYDYLTLQLRGLLSKKKGITFLSFYNYMSLPYFIAEKLFKSFLTVDTQILLSSIEFSKALAMLYAGKIENKINMLFNIFDYNHDDIIHFEDVKIFFVHFTILNKNQGNCNAIKIINDSFIIGGMNTMTKEQFKTMTLNSNSDMFMLFLSLLIFHKPWNAETLDFYIETIWDNNTNNKTWDIDEVKQSFMTIYPPSSSLFNYLIENYPTFSNECDLNDLDEFEVSFTELTSPILSKETTKHNILGLGQLTQGIQKPKKLISNLMNLPTKEENDFHSISTTTSSLTLPVKIQKASSLSISSISPFIKSTECYWDYFYSNKEGNNHKFKFFLLGQDIYIFKPSSDSNGKFNEDDEALSFIRIVSTKKMYLDIITLEDNKKFPIKLYTTLSEGTKASVWLFDSVHSQKKFIDVVNSRNGYRKFDDYYKKISTIGKGTYGVVIKAEKIEDQSIVAIKTLKKDYLRMDHLDLIYSEHDISKFIMKMPHQGIIKVIDLFETFEEVIIVEEYISSGSLDSFIQKNHGSIPAVQASILLKDLIDAVHFLSVNGIVHRDLKTQNVLIEINDTNRIITPKIIDFGLSKIIGYDEKLSGRYGTLSYLPPEMIKHRDYSYKIDVWTLGIVGFILLCGYHPFYSKNRDEVTNSILYKKLEIPHYDNDNEHYLRKIVLACLERETNKRADIRQLYLL